jgi:hypothetical protein
LQQTFTGQPTEKKLPKIFPAKDKKSLEIPDKSTILAQVQGPKACQPGLYRKTKSLLKAVQNTLSMLNRKKIDPQDSIYLRAYALGAHFRSGTEIP